MASHYLDWNATAPLAPAARAAWLLAYDVAWANPGSVHAPGQSARHHVDQIKAQCARLLGCKTHELVVTSGGTEANALAIHSVTVGQELTPGAVVMSAIEHSSVLRNGEGVGAVRLPVDSCGRLLPETIRSAVSPTTRLLCLQFANNEIGVCQDVPAIVAALRSVAPQARVLLDCAQGAGKAELNLSALNIDFASIAGHKFGAPKGIGLLYVKNGVRITPLQFGGKQQQDRRSGTEDVAGLAALHAALASALAHGEEESIRQRMLLEGAFARIALALPRALWLAHAAERLPNTLSIVHPGVINGALVMRLDLAGVAVSTGSACMAARGEPSHVIAALGIEESLAKSVIRVSIGPDTTGENIDAFVNAYIREVKAMIGQGR
jgi:cysteine desulfurase